MRTPKSLLNEAIEIKGVVYLPVKLAAKRMGVSEGHLYNLNAKDKDIQKIRVRYRGRIFYEEKGIESYMESQLERYA